MLSMKIPETVNSLIIDSQLIQKRWSSKKIRPSNEAATRARAWAAIERSETSPYVLRLRMFSWKSGGVVLGSFWDRQFKLNAKVERMKDHYNCSMSHHVSIIFSRNLATEQLSYNLSFVQPGLFIIEIQEI